MTEAGGDLLRKWKLVGLANLDPDLTAMSRRVLYLLLEHMDRKTGGFGYAVDWLAQKLDADQSNVRGALRELVARQYVERIKKAGCRTSSGPANLYIPIFREAGKDYVKKPALEVVETRQKSQPLGGEDYAKKPSHDYAKKPAISLLSNPAKEMGGSDPGRPLMAVVAANPIGEPSAEETAAEFWRLYPRSHRKEDQRGVTRKILHILKAGEATPGELLAGLAGYAKSPDVVKDQGGQFVKAPIVFLNKQTWKTFLPGGAGVATAPNKPAPISPAARRAAYEVHELIEGQING